MPKAPYRSTRVKLLAKIDVVGDGLFDVRCPSTNQHIGPDGAHAHELVPLTEAEMHTAIRLHKESCTG
jgi:hypothetical protein